MHRNRVHELLRSAPYILAAAGVSALAIYGAIRSNRTNLIVSFEDDAYYYLEIAYRVAMGEGSTFDGISRTNGYHPLWLLLLTPIYVVVRDKYFALIVVKVLSAISWSLAVLGVYKIATLLNARVLFLPSLLLLLYTRDFWFSGMETTALLTLLVWLIVPTLKIMRGDAQPATFGLAGVLLALVLLSRLDSVFFAVPYVATVLWRSELTSIKTRSTNFFALAFPSVALLSAYILSNAIFFDRFAPISVQAKSFGERFSNFDVFTQYLAYRPVTAPLLRHLDMKYYLLILIVPAFLLPRILVRINKRSSAMRTVADLQRVLLVVMTANLLQLTYYAVASTWPLWRWYHYYTPLALLFAAVIVSAAAVDSSPHGQRIASKAPAVFVLLILVVLTRNLLYIQPEYRGASNYKSESVKVAQFLNGNTRADGVFAMGDRAGSLGYQLDRALIQTEGLVNSNEYLKSLVEGRVNEFLKAKGLDYIVYSSGELSGGNPEPVRLEDPERPCRRIREPKVGSGPKLEIVVCDDDVIYDAHLEAGESTGERYTVWKYRAELN